MLKKNILFFVLICFSLPLFAKHIAGGEMSYVYLGAGNVANTGKYRITLKLYRDCFTDGAQLDATASITIYPNGSTSYLMNVKADLNKKDVISLTTPNPCISNPPTICYEIGYYITEVELPFTLSGYVVSYQRCCRINGIFNVVNSQDAGVTYTTNIPGTAQVSNGPINSTPVFKTSDTVVVCAGNYFTYDFGATDVDKGDVLSYSFEDAYLGGDKNTPTPSNATAPPYEPLTYSFGFSSQLPLGSNVNISATTGMISGVAPAAGIYVVTVAVTERRGGFVINVHRKDLHLKVADCSIASADLNPTYISCDGFTLNFANNSTSPLITSYDWDFGVVGSTVDVSSSANPVFTYPVAGNYTVTLITNKGKQCSDTATTIAKIYPGFVPAFNVVQTCQGVPYTFTDATQATYGTVNSWHWDFGNSVVTNDTANTSSTSYVYNTNGTYNVALIVKSSIGCVDTLIKSVTVDNKPALTITKDTLICSVDQLQLNASGTGSFVWTPNYQISSTSVPNPIVKPKVGTRYSVTLTQAPGCTNTASVFVDVRDFVSLDAGMDTTICLGDSIRLAPISDALNYTWSPASTVSNPLIKQPWVKPTGTTRYSVIARIGTCQANDGFVVNTVPYPKAYAGKDTSICVDGVAQLHATGGQQYLWYPPNTLNNNTLQDPIATPYETTAYVVGVYENYGCPKPVYDTVVVAIIPPVKAFAGNDTAVVIGQPLQMAASGALNYIWTPSSFLSNPYIWNPVAKLNDDQTYIVRVSTKEGCYAFDTVNVKVYKTPPEIFVPTAFTPNGDGLNDQLLPIPVGISQIVYFKVYNRYGEMVFSTNEIGKGWNGIYKGRDQGNESFVWHVLGIDYLGKPVFKKGESTLIR